MAGKSVRYQLEMEAKGFSAAARQAQSEFNSLTNGLAAGAGRFGEIAKAAGPAGLAIAAIGGAAVMAAGQVVSFLSGAAKAAVETGGKLQDLATASQTSAEGLQRMAATGKASVEEIASGIQILQRRLTETPEEFQALGLEVSRLKAMDGEGLIRAIADRIQQLPPGLQQSQAAMAAFGKSGAQYLPLLLSDLRGAADEAMRTGRVLSNETVAGLDAVGEQTKLAAAQWDAFKNQLGAAMANNPAVLQSIVSIADGLAQLTRFVMANKDAIGQWVTSFVGGFERIGGALAKLGSNSVVQRLNSWVGSAISWSTGATLLGAVGGSSRPAGPGPAFNIGNDDPLGMRRSGLNPSGRPTGPGSSFDPEAAERIRQRIREQEAAARKLAEAWREVRREAADYFRTAGAQGPESRSAGAVMFGGAERVSAMEAARRSIQADIDAANIEAALAVDRAEQARREEAARQRTQAIRDDIRAAAQETFDWAGAIGQVIDGFMQLGVIGSPVLQAFAQGTAASVQGVMSMRSEMARAGQIQREYAAAGGSGRSDQAQAVTNNARLAGAIGSLTAMLGSFSAGRAAGQSGGSRAGSAAMGALNTGMMGAQLGSTFGTLGAIIGGGLGAAAGAISSLIGHARGAAQALKEQNRELKETHDILEDIRTAGNAAAAQLKAMRAGMDIEGLDDLVNDLTEKVVSGMTGLIDNFKVETEADARALGAMFSASFWAVVRQRGLMGASDAFREAFHKLMDQYKALGIDAASTPLGTIGALLDLGADEKFRSLATAAESAATMLEGLGGLGFADSSVLGGSADMIMRLFQDMFDRAKASGLSDQDAFRAAFTSISNLLTQYLDQTRRSGGTVDPRIAGLMGDAAEQGIRPLTTVAESQLQTQRDILAAIYGIRREGSSSQQGQQGQGEPDGGQRGENEPTPHGPRRGDYAEGGWIPATTGGQIIRVAEGGEGESIVPDSERVEWARDIMAQEGFQPVAIQSSPTFNMSFAGARRDFDEFNDRAGATITRALRQGNTGLRRTFDDVIDKRLVKHRLLR